ncbi:MAG TPA: 4-hydroxy-tetrahydrodipicolinate reductase [Myxococcaceae bacterium]|nr:4-hydroxy-tetrahydrodipicolinate reductase [Myxococcaceae bacterium]
MIRAVITGVAGRMGRTVARMVRDQNDMKVAGGTEKKGAAAIGLDVGTVAGIGTLDIPVTDDLGRALERGQGQLVIDFTSAESSLEHARIGAERGVPLVIGSTGFSPEAKAEVARLANKVAIVMSPNMSVGVNLMINVARELAQVLGESFDVEILEAHHRMKKDAPSGTALRLADEVAAVLKRSPSDFLMARQGQIGERAPEEIGIQALRGGDVVGEHTVFFFGEGERVELTHRATSRDQFAKGALRAGRWVIGRPPGLYSMNDVLGLG